MVLCRRCGEENPEHARFCLACGLRLSEEPARDERRVISVLFADVVAFTARAEQMDPEDVRSFQDPYWEHLRAEIERHGGTVEKFVGDAVMAVFGAPVAHEDDPERAVRAGLAICEWARKQAGLEVRVGVTTGEALVRLAADPLLGEGMASGDVVNTAARVQAAAPANGVLVGEVTCRATKHVIDYRVAEPVQAKGKAAPILVWQAVAARSRFGVDVTHHARVPLIGRGRELELLLSTFAHVRDARSPQLVTLVGVPGVGKSRLVYELWQRVAAESAAFTWLQGRLLPYGQGVSFSALSEIVKAKAGIFEADADDEVERKLSRTLEEILGGHAEAGWVESHLRPLVGLTRTSAVAADRQEESLAAWRFFLEELADQRPLVLVLEDLQWADDGLLDFIDQFVERASSVPIFVVATTRPELLERRPGWGAGRLNASSLEVAALTDDDTVRLLEALLEHSTLATAIDHTLIAQTGGNPLYADQYARMLAERSSGGELPVPESVQGIIAARLDLLLPEEKSLLQQAAVVGKVFWLGSLVDGSSRTEVEQRLRTLERKGFVQRAGQSSVEAEPEYTFRHVLVRDVAYGQIPRGARRDNHRRAAEWIESLGRVEDHAEMLAHHYSVTLELAQATGQEANLLTQRTRLAFRRAAERALRLNAFGAAARYYEQALELWPPDEDDRAQVVLAYGKALHVAERRGHQVLRDARDALLLAGDIESAAVAEADLGALLWEDQQAEQALRHLTEAVELLRVRPASPAKTQVLISLARVKVFTGDAAEAARLADEALTAAEDLALDTERADALNYRGAARFVLGDLEGGIADLEHSLELALAANNVPALLRAYNNLAGSLEGAGQIGRARDLYREGLSLAERLGDPDEISWYRRELAETLVRGGWWKEALELFESTDEDGVQPAPAAIALARGDAEPALRCALSLIEGSREAGRADGRAAVLAFYADALVAAGRREEAAAVADELAATLQEIPLTNLAWPGIAIALAQTGRSDALLSALATARPTPWAEAAAAYGSGEFVVAADLYAGLGDRFDEALARLEAARQLVGHGRRGDARTQLDKALSFFNSVAATRYIAEADKLMNAPA